MRILITALAAGLIAQLSKFFVKSNNVKLKWHYLWSYSGMPSSHAAITTALTASVGLSQGADSPLFAVSLIFTLLVIRDAVGLRRYLGIGHTWPQILAGCLVGLLISLIGYLL
ncbi:MAG: divergent PAP2 family protein [bacterium]|nr:divergent PAP2 family protein [bacterium]